MARSKPQYTAVRVTYAAPGVLPEGLPLWLTASFHPPGNSLTCCGETWIIVYEGRVLPLRDRIGLKLLKILLANPGKEFHVHELSEACIKPKDSAARQSCGRMSEVEFADSGLEPSDLGDAGELVDERAVADLRKKLRILSAEREEAEATGDEARLGQVDQETEAIERYLSAGLDKRGRPRRTSRAVEKERKFILQHISRTIRKIAKEDAEIGRHLRLSIITGTYCRYELAESTNWTCLR